MGDHSYLVPAFITLLALGGQVGLPFLVLTFFRSKRLNRHSTFVNFCFTVIFYSLVLCILPYTGQYRLAQPNHTLCIAQASMVVGIFPMVGVAAFIVVLQTWATFQSPFSTIYNTFERPFVLSILLVSPYATFIGYLLGSILVARYHPDSVWANNGLYCFFKLKVIWYYLSPVTSLVLMTVTAVLEVAIIIQWYWRRRCLKKAFPLASKKAQIMTWFRVFVFNAYTWLVLAASVLFQKRLTPAIPYMAEAALPLATFLVFGTQEDILEAWGIRKAPPETSLAMPDQSPVASTISSINC